MKVETKIKIVNEGYLSVSNDLAYPTRVILKVDGKFEINVIADELQKAIQNARNT